jgi:hypothetical protein
MGSWRRGRQVSLLFGNKPRAKDNALGSLIVGTRGHITVTEVEWLTCRDPTLLLRHYRRAAPTDRKLRLFAVLCCRRVWARLPDDRCREAVAVCERFAEGTATRAELEVAQSGAEAAFTEYDDRDGWETAASAVSAACEVTDLLVFVGQTARETALLVWPRDRRRAEYQWQCRVARDIFGNPFRPVPFASDWRTDTTLTLARQMYDARDFSAMPILADGLQDAGCDSADILDHCRGLGPHVRGCWCVDLVLGRG